MNPHGAGDDWLVVSCETGVAVVVVYIALRLALLIWGAA